MRSLFSIPNDGSVVCMACIFHSLLLFLFNISLPYGSRHVDRFFLWFFFCLVVDHSISFRGLVWILRVVSHILSAHNNTNLQLRPKGIVSMLISKICLHFFLTIFFVVFLSPICACFCRFIASFILIQNYYISVFVVRKQIELIIISSSEALFIQSSL